MEKKDLHTIIFPFLHLNDQEQYFMVGKCKSISGIQDLSYRLENILNEAKTAEAFSVYDCIKEKFIDTSKSDLLNELSHAMLIDVRNLKEIRHRLRYELLDFHIVNEILNDSHFMDYLKKRLEEEFFGNYRYIITMKLKSSKDSKAYCLIDNFNEIEIIEL